MTNHETATVELTETQKAYNAAQYEIFQLAAYGHCTYTNGEMLTDEGKRQQADYNDRIRAAREELEAALLRLVGEHAETFRGDWGVPAAWLRSLADDPAGLSLLAVRPDEREHDAAPAAVSVPPPAPRADDQAALRDRIRRALCEASGNGFMWGTDMLEPDEYGEVADAVLAVLPEPADRAAVLREAADLVAADTGFHIRYGSATDYAEHYATLLRRLADEAQQPAPHSCRNCEGIDPDTCLMNPDRPADSRPRCPDCQMPHDLTPGMALACASIRASIAGRDAAVSGPCVAGEQQNETREDGAGEPAELRDLPREVRHLVHAVDRMRSDWAEAPEGGPERREMWTAVHAACDAVWNRDEVPE